MSLASGMTRGIVTRATSAGVWVKLPTLYADSEIGPLDYLGPRNTHSHPGVGAVTTTATVFGAGDRVLVGAVDAGDWIVLGRIERAAN